MIDVLIGIDYYYEFVTGRMRRRATGGPVALETLLGWVVCGRTSPKQTAEVESSLTNPEHSAVTLLRKNGEIDEVEILPEEDVPEKNKEAREEREQTSTSGAAKRRVSFPRRSGQRGLPNVAKRTRRQLAIAERDLKKWATENPCRLGPEWPAEPPRARQRSHEDSGRTTGSPQGGKSPQGQSTLTATMNDAAVGPRHSQIKGNAAGMLRIRVYRQHSVRRQSARSEHGDAEPAEGELHRIEVTRKQRMGKEDPDTPVSMSHTAVPSGRH
ncbi:hypothetical protein T09_14567, partial [Trichinella sp. T9]